MTASALVFDLDDTLYPESEFALSGFAAVGRWLLHKRALAGFATEAQRLFEGGLRGRIFDAALQRLGAGDAADLIPELVAVYRAHKPRLNLFPDAQWVITSFQGRLKLGLITDGYGQTQRNKIASLGLEASFNALVFTDDLGRKNWKPSPRPYREMMQALGAQAAACIYVGDNPVKDFVAPNRLGWTTVQIMRERGEYAQVTIEDLPADHHPRHVIRSLRELEAILP